MSEGKNMQQWLKNIMSDQDLEKLSDLENIQLDTLRRYFLSQSIQPTIELAHYDTTLKKYVLGSAATSTAQNSVWDKDNLGLYGDRNTASQAALTFTCPAGYACVVWHISAKNNTDTPVWSVTFLPKDGVYSVNYGAESGTQTGFHALMELIGIVNPIIMQPGDALTITDDTFSGGDTMTHNITYSKIAL